ncbi:MAG TPA: hypothetical protein VL727_06775 [Puia sp.]|nr:hypothetical protein [Puia sp.]
MKHVTLLLLLLPFFAATHAQEAWPKKISAPDGTLITIYQPQPEQFKGNELVARSAIAVQTNSNPVFGTFWWKARVTTDRDLHSLTLDTIEITAIKIPGDSTKGQLDAVKAALQAQLPAASGTLSMDDILVSLDQEMDEARLSHGIATQPPVILFVQHPSVLVTIDGEPRLEENHKWGLQAVANSPFTIVQNKDRQFYLWGGSRWYTAAAATGPYTLYTSRPDHRLRKIERSFKKAERSDTIPTIVVTTAPAELLQTDSTPVFLPIEGTTLLYASNSPNDIFIDTQSQAYYILLSGRWYTSANLQGGTNWTYVPSDKLPTDFAKIPEGSPKDNVLASVAGTAAAKEAVMDAQIPQTARIDRSTATTQVQYDGDPRFEAIAGTSLQYAVNASSTVFLYNGSYYALDNGVWFIAGQPNGPWKVSTIRPSGLDGIPPTCPVYNAKYVDIYEVEPDYIYMGYTPGYLNNFVFGPTVVYGTGFAYSPWLGHYYYPRPWSWGFGMIYNPWYGWGFGVGFGFDWFDADLGLGWWGPDSYYPCFWGAGWGYASHSFYGREPRFEPRMQLHAHNNLYRGRPGVLNHVQRPLAGSRPAGVVADRRGNVFERNSQGQWLSHSPAVRPEGPALDRMQHFQDRGAVRSANFQRMQHFSAPHFGGFHGGGRR